MARSLADIIHANWRQLASLARVVWDELTLDELITSRGDAQALIGLVQTRYGMSRTDAEKQVMSFFERHRNA